MADEAKVYDAVFVPQGKVKGATDNARLAWYRTEFGPVLGKPRRVFARQVDAGAALLLTGDGRSDHGRAHLYHHETHELSGQSRYEWADVRGDGILYGTLTEEGKNDRPEA
jgi:hypothetical protein